MVYFSTRWLLAIAGLLAFTPPIFPQTVDPLDLLNKTFRDAHVKSRTVVLDRAGPIIVVDFDTLILIHKKSRTEVEVVPPLYHRLKSIAHAPLGIYLILTRAGTGKLSEEHLAELRHLRNAFQAANKAISEKTFAREQLERQRKILETCSKFLDRVIDAGSCASEDLITFARQGRPLLMANAEEAAKVQIESYDAKTAEWRGKMSAEDWGKLRVVVMGSALPRRGNVAVQYFAKVLGEAGEGKRVLYAEALFDEAKALRLLAATEIDADMGRAFFADPTRLHRDLLADAAAQYLKEHGAQLKALAPSQK